MQIDIAYKITYEISTELLLFYLEKRLEGERSKKILLYVRLAKTVGVYLLP
jgi:hypothetical protein